nr:AAA family ATPase [Bacteroides intestinalis]
MENVITAIGAELSKQRQLAEDIPEKTAMFTVRTANRTLQEAANRPDPVPLWLSLWYEGEVCCLFADSNLGKSIYAVQIAGSIAVRCKVLYFDFELSDKQFQLRYTDPETGKCHEFPPDLYRVEISRDYEYPDGSFEDTLIMEIERLAVEAECRILIIDNLSYLCMTSEKGEDAGRLMSRLMELKRKYALSILILAHTPKRQLNMPITQNDLAGSKKLYNFFDSVFAIGKSAKDGNLRYIKQLKVRYGCFEYGADNVIVCSIEKAGDFLQFVTVGYATEATHLKEITGEEREKLKSESRELHSQGLSYRDIGRQLGISKTTAERYCKT